MLNCHSHSRQKEENIRKGHYRQIYDLVRAQIMAGVYRPGDKLPTEVELAAAHGVSRGTAAMALTELAREGLVRRVPRRGTVVLESTRPAEVVTHRVIAWIRPDSDYPFDLDLLRGLERTARAAGYNLLLYLTEMSLGEEEQAIRDARSAGAVGIALCLQDGETYNAEVLRLVVDGFPLVLVDRYLRGIQCASVQSDNVAGARELVTELISAGHQQICALVYPPAGTSTIEDRLEGYAQALANAGILFDRALVHIVEPFDSTADTGRVPEAQLARFASYLAEHPTITAVFATNAALAMLTLRAAEELHLHIPTDLSVINIDPLSTVPLSPPLFTCSQQPGFDMGRAAVELLLEQLAGQPPRRVQFPMRLQSEGSIASPHVRTGTLANQREST